MTIGALGLALFFGCVSLQAQDSTRVGSAATTVANITASTTQAELGKPAPDFEATDQNGKKFKLSDRLRKQKYIILMFSRANW